MQKIIENEIETYKKEIIMECQTEEIYKESETEQNREHEQTTQGTIDQQQNLQQKLEDISKIIEKSYNELKQEENKILEVAKKIGLDYSIRKIENTEMYSTINQIREISREIQKENEIENIEKVNIKVEEIESIIEREKIKTEYVTEMRGKFAKSFDKKIQEIIKMSKLTKLEEEKKQVENEKISLIGKVTGKGKLKEIKLNNIDLKIQTTMLEKIKDKNDITLEESISDLYTYSEYELGKQVTTEIQQFTDLINEEPYLKDIINMEKVKTQTGKKINEKQSQWYLIPIDYKKKTRKRQQMEILQIQNNEMRRQILNNRAKTVTKQNDVSLVEISNKTLNKLKEMVREINLVFELNKN